MRAALLLSACLLCGPALAHAGHVHWTELASTWTWDPLIVAPLVLSLTIYALGVGRLWRRAGVGRGVRMWQVGCFALAWLLLFGALVAPLHWLGERLFMAHMIEHEILMTLAAPLLVVARPFGAALWGAPPSWRRGWGHVARSRAAAAMWAWITTPLVATLVHGLTIWLWHAPALYDAALASPRLHWLEHVSFFASALVFWWALLRGPGRERAFGAAVFYLFVTSLHTGFLGVLLSVTRRPLYPVQTREALAWGLSPLEDQQLAGLIMWVPGGMVYAIAALALCGVWIARSSRHPPGALWATPN
ncbi:MAG: Membrane protein [Hyphomicrobiales bacterium]|nr:Membrane protein [Hyphomicrobiales bacterium]